MSGKNNLGRLSELAEELRRPPSEQAGDTWEDGTNIDWGELTAENDKLMASLRKRAENGDEEARQTLEDFYKNLP
ncbi:MAG: hypothetical protein A3J93_01530 [Candidatus Magasanikbacteria bacterium RIFOXYC2_FULL_42_28]|uniref:Uncharacterized protein n=1 Tax=Candidatus Magasanikbacteria bacterium RIFOXYC2_FULL_42_28 TaxID=1798704 RepID=A0A1F6NYL8_9BACT|nr:MAG: hypothetical protein A3J93_01530 [Candidatus Magasanikbacteria bacterium RIFOXYC2_FULL_42_28]